MKPVPASQAAPLIACVLATGDARDRLRLQYAREDAAKIKAVSLDELFAAREIAQRYGYSVQEAVEIVRRSRK